MRHSPAGETRISTPSSSTRLQFSCARLAWNHPLPDGNKRAAWASLVVFVELNEGRWSPDPPVVDDAEVAMLAIASHEWSEAQAAAWLDDRIVFADTKDS